MRTTILWVGKTRTAFLDEGIAHYGRLVARYGPFETRAVRETKLLPKADPRQVIAEEGQRLLAAVPPAAHLVALDPAGRGLDSPALAAYIKRRREEGVKDLVFALGGPLGLSRAVLERAQLALSLSPLTLTHEMVRLVLLEQLYRAETILRGEPYHK